jgi:hypothetical protein
MVRLCRRLTRNVVLIKLKNCKEPIDTGEDNAEESKGSVSKEFFM